MSKKPVVLMILDGYGLNDKTEGNAVALANTPVMDALEKEYPFVKGNASGLAVGLPDGQMGNSEVGHMNMGAGRIVYQELTRITKEIQDGDFFKNEALCDAMDNCKKNDSALHVFGLLSDGGVHSHITHLYGILEMAKQQGLSKVYVHAFMDGRDTAPTSGKEFIQNLCDKMKELGKGKELPAILTGDFNVDQTHQSYDAFVSKGVLCDSYEKAGFRYAINGTFNDFDPNSFTESRIDHIFVSPSFQVKRYGVLTDTYRSIVGKGEKKQANDCPEEIDIKTYQARTPSDHFPVKVELEFDQRQQK